MIRNTIAAALVVATLPFAALAEGMTHYVAVHVDQDDARTMNIVLNNVQNMNQYYAENGDTAVFEVVAHGPGLKMFIPGESPVEQRVSVLALEMDNLSFSACGNTLKGMEKKAGHKIELMSEAMVVPAGAVRLVELQEQGYAYLRP